MRVLTSRYPLDILRPFLSQPENGDATIQELTEFLARATGQPPGKSTLAEWLSNGLVIFPKAACKVTETLASDVPSTLDDFKAGRTVIFTAQQTIAVWTKRGGLMSTISNDLHSYLRS